ncbi:MAG: hypothetical protein DRO18_02615 [Thermoprotei archaeon]|nr:MAG: hypothetical protein DRO18_02615 [Thermoprotei archaeon]
MKLIYTAMSKRRFYLRAHICRFVFGQGHIPVNPFMCFDYFLLDTVDRDLIRKANSRLLSACDELWVFGEVSNGVLREINQARKEGKRIKFFKIVDKPLRFIEIRENEVVYEDMD